MRHSCPICLRTDPVQPLLVKNGCQLYGCGHCDHVFVDPQPSDQELSRIYSFAAGYQATAASQHAGSPVPPKFARSLDEIGRHVTRGSLLDVGCSSGRFLAAAREYGYEVQGIELNPHTARIARGNGLRVFVGQLEFAGLPPESFDVVHLGDIIEHVRDPVSFLEQVKKLLRPEGVVLIVTPNHDAFFPRATLALYRALGIPWSHATPPHHLHQFSVRSLSLLLDRCGLAVKESGFAPCSLPYELRSTGVFGPLKDALRNRRPLRVATGFVRCAAVSICYAALWLADRAAFAKRRDFEMRVVASHSPLR